MGDKIEMRDSASARMTDQVKLRCQYAMEHPTIVIASYFSASRKRILFNGLQNTSCPAKRFMTFLRTSNFGMFRAYDRY